MLSKITSLIHYVESNLSWPSITSDELMNLGLLMCFIILSAIETQRPKRKWPLKQLRQSYRTNIGFFIEQPIESFSENPYIVFIA